MKLRLGKNQLRLLMTLGSPGTILVSALPGDREVNSLVKRGLLREQHGHRITPAGLRALADAMERGDLGEMIQTPPPDATPDVRWQRKLPA